MILNHSCKKFAIEHYLFLEEVCILPWQNSSAEE
jgi:hypothetical protein